MWARASNLDMLREVIVSDSMSLTYALISNNVLIKAAPKQLEGL